MGLIGIWVGKNLEARTDTRRWQRETRTAAYELVAITLHEYYYLAAMMSVSDDIPAEALARFTDVTMNLIRAVAKVEVTGPEDVAKAAREFASSLSTMVQADLHDPRTTDGWTALWKAQARMVEPLIDKFRRNLDD